MGGRLDPKHVPQLGFSFQNSLFYYYTVGTFVTQKGKPGEGPFKSKACF